MSHLAAPHGRALRQDPSRAATKQGVAPHATAQSASPAFSPVLLNDEQSAACLGVSVRKFHELRKEAWMPRPHVLGPRLLKWSRLEIERAIADIPRLASPSPEPSQLLRGRIEKAKRTGSLAKTEGAT